MLKLGCHARELRFSLGLTQKELADQLGVTNVHISNIENDESTPSADLLDRYRVVTGVDLYLFAWCRCGDTKKLPDSIRKPAEALTRAWDKILDDRFRGRT